MKLLLIRHGLAADREEFARSKNGADDSERPLTGKGRRRMQAAAHGLSALLDETPWQALLTSPYVRAAQTAEVLQRELGGPEPVESEALLPAAEPEELLRALRNLALDGDAVVAAVGHEPHLSTTASWFLTGRDRSLLDLKKGSATLLELGDDPESGTAVLAWCLPPRALRRMGS
jgi:phosphohistidine phosphatase